MPKKNSPPKKDDHVPPNKTEIEKRAAILESTGFTLDSETSRQTAIKLHCKPISLTNRVDTFINEDLRRESYLNIKNKFKSESKYGTNSVN